MAREFANHPLLKRVGERLVLNLRVLKRLIDNPPFFCQVRELADEEMLQDTELHFEWVNAVCCHLSF